MLHSGSLHTLNSRVAYEISALQTGKQQTRKQRSNQQQQHNYRSRLSKRDRSCSNLASSAMKSPLLLNDLSIEIHEHYNQLSVSPEQLPDSIMIM